MNYVVKEVLNGMKIICMIGLVIYIIGLTGQLETSDISTGEYLVKAGLSMILLYLG